MRTSAPRLQPRATCFGRHTPVSGEPTGVSCRVGSGDNVKSSTTFAHGEPHPAVGLPPAPSVQQIGGSGSRPPGLLLITAFLAMTTLACNQQPAVVSPDAEQSESPAAASSANAAPSEMPAPTSASGVEYTTETLESIKSQVESGAAVLLDVRSQGEWDDSHLTISKFIPITVLSDKTQLPVAVAELDREKTVYTHCKRGGRAMTAAKILAEQGFIVKPIGSPYESFAEAGFDTVEVGK